MTDRPEQHRISVLIPVRNEIDGLPRLREAVAQLRVQLADRGYASEVIVTDNASRDGSGEFLRQWASSETDFCYCRYAQDYGFQPSLMFGMTQASGDALVVLQSDLQDPPELILEFVERWADGAKVVAGVAVNRDEGALSLWSRRVFYRLLDLVSDRAVVRGFQDFYLIDRSVYVPLSHGPMVHQFLRGRISAEFGVDAVVEYHRNAREVGRSKFSFASKYSLALDGLLLFGHRFFRLISVLSVGLLLLSLGVLALLLAIWILGYRPPVAGWMSVAAGMSLVVAILAGGFGLVLEYLIRIYRIIAVSNEVRVALQVDTRSARSRM